MKKFEKNQPINKVEKVKHLFYHKHNTIDEIADEVKISTRTVYRYLNKSKKERSSSHQSNSDKSQKSKKYSEIVRNKIIALKQENPKRSATIIRDKLKLGKISPLPSESTIRRYLVEAGMGKVASEYRRGYTCFERKQANELWQIDIAGVQTVGHLGQLYLFALLDDKSRFIPAAFYADNQKGTHVIRLLQKAITNYGRPAAIVADNGTQFRNIIKSISSKYEKILDLLDIETIFARARHPQTKGKLERFFGSVKTMWLSEVRFQVQNHPEWTLIDFNIKFQEWLEFYNYKHRHRSLPHRNPPSEIYFNTNPRIYRPLEVQFNWDTWIQTSETRKVSKTNFISFHGERFTVPAGYAGLEVEIRILDTKIDIFRKNQCIATHSVNFDILKQKKKKTRRIAHAGTIGYNGKHYTVSYKMAGQEVSVKESLDGTTLLVYHHDVLIKEILL